MYDWRKKNDEERAEFSKNERRASNLGMLRRIGNMKA
jgi:hypothetical protein